MVGPNTRPCANVPTFKAQRQDTVEHQGSSGGCDSSSDKWEALDSKASGPVPDYVGMPKIRQTAPALGVGCDVGAKVDKSPAAGS